MQILCKFYANFMQILCKLGPTSVKCDSTAVKNSSIGGGVSFDSGSISGSKNRLKRKPRVLFSQVKRLKVLESGNLI